MSAFQRLKSLIEDNTTQHGRLFDIFIQAIIIISLISFSSVFASMWWAVSTLTTVGYGDVVPVTDWGKVFTFFTLVIGLGIMAVPTGIMASALSEARRMAANANKPKE